MRHRHTHPIAIASFALVASSLAACGGGGGGGGGGTRLAPPRAVNDPSQPFATALACAECHGNSPTSVAMRETTDGTPALSDAPIGQFDLWRASMMANSARDPFWRAQVSAEVAATPSRQAEIEGECMRCHAPMAVAQAELAGDPAPGMATLLGNDDIAQLALDGVSCAMCHKIEEGNLQDDASFSGGFVVSDTRTIFGPHASPFATPMAAFDQFLVQDYPTADTLTIQSALCATCHTLETAALAPNGTPTGGHTQEQAPYLEWRNSVYVTADEAGGPGDEPRSCISCHAPTEAGGLAIETEIARDRLGGDDPNLAPRSPFAKHTFVGGNTLMLSILRDEAGSLQPYASSAEFDAQIARTAEFLKDETAEIEIESTNITASNVSFEVRVKNKAGHKFPTGFPSRRAWLHVKVTRPSDGVVIFESGRPGPDGRIVNRSGQVLASEEAGDPEPHRQVIDSDENVQIYESVMKDGAGQPTFLLLRGEGFLKDNRILPEGYSVAGQDPRTAPVVGLVADSQYEDPAAANGEDIVQYVIDIPAGTTNVLVEARLLFQSVSPRFAAELFRSGTKAAREFRRFYERTDRTPFEIDAASNAIP